VGFQVDLIERATLHDRGEFIVALLNFDPAVCGVSRRPPSQAIVVAITYARPHLLPVLTRIWPLPDDLPHAAGTGNLSGVKRWFDESGRAATAHGATRSRTSSDRHRPPAWPAA